MTFQNTQRGQLKDGGFSRVWGFSHTHTHTLVKHPGKYPGGTRHPLLSGSVAASFYPTVPRGLAHTLLLFSAPVWVRRIICQLHHHHSVRAAQERAEGMNQMCVPWERDIQLIAINRLFERPQCGQLPTTTEKMQYWFQVEKVPLLIGTAVLCMGFVKLFIVLRESGGCKWILPGWEIQQCSHTVVGGSSTEQQV